MNTEFTLTQKRALAVVTIISLLFAGYFLRNYFVLIVVAAVGAYLFTPLFNWFGRRLGSGLAATCTLLTALAVVIVPIGLLVVLAIVQISRMVTHVAGWVRRTNLSDLGDTQSAGRQQALGAGALPAHRPSPLSRCEKRW